MKFRSDKDDDVDVNLTPLIDVVFLLLIFFMISTTFDHQAELNIDLPEAKGELADTQDKFIEISINAKGQYYINQVRLNETSIDSLMTVLGEKIKDNHEVKVVISADKNTPHQSVMTVMDIARRLNITHLTFAAVKPD